MKEDAALHCRRRQRWKATHVALAQPVSALPLARPLDLRLRLRPQSRSSTPPPRPGKTGEIRGGGRRLAAPHRSTAAAARADVTSETTPSDSANSPSPLGSPAPRSLSRLGTHSLCHQSCHQHQIRVALFISSGVVASVTGQGGLPRSSGGGGRGPRSLTSFL